MPSDHANIAAAQSAGYIETVLDRGSAWNAAVRYEVVLEKRLVGGTGASGHNMRAYGQGSTQANAETQALAALNQQRRERYGDSSAVSTDTKGNPHTVDVT